MREAFVISSPAFDGVHTLIRGNSLMRHFAITVVLVLSSFTLLIVPSCRHTTEPPFQPPKNPREYTFTIDTLVPPEIPQTVMGAMWGTSRNNLYIVGHNAGFGRSMYHYDGQKWSGVGLKLGEGGTVTNIGTLNNIFGFAANDIYAVGYRYYHDPPPLYTGIDSSLILHFDGSAWTQMITPPGRGMQAIWGIRPDDVWAGGTCGTLFHSDGHTWTSIGNFSADIWFARINGFASNDVYALAYSIPDSVNVWHRYYMWHWDGSSWTLQDSFVENNYHKFGSDALNVIDGQLYSGGIGVFKMSGASWSRVYYSPSDMAFASVRGTSSDNIFAAGGRGLLVHYNGKDWYRYSQFSGLDILLADSWTDGNELFVVAEDGWSTYIIHGQ
jgi:hypothetical protein